jgi:phospholipid/cholesterol/gamma-HCH transport system permease protein
LHVAPHTYTHTIMSFEQTTLPLANAPTLAPLASPEGVRFILRGSWTAPHAHQLEIFAQQMREGAIRTHAFMDLTDVVRLDTLGAWLLDRTRFELTQKGLNVEFSGLSPEHRLLLDEVAYRSFEQPTSPKRSHGMDFLADIGESVSEAARDFASGTAFLGEVVAGVFRVMVKPKRFRGPSLVHHIEQIAFRGVPIIVLISFLVGCIVAQQGIFQLQRFGATPFVVNMVAVLSLRELGLLLASIMVAGRSGSAFTAEIGSMKMREEVDALQVMGLNPIEVLIVPRILALVISLPLLTFLASISAIFGGLLVAWFYGDISPDVFLSRLQAAVDIKMLMVGLIKAPFMALVIGIIACLEGLAVKGSAESLGRRVTASVVKAIFMVIVLDGFFAMFFAAIKF